ncbi:agamous-like MADS-box protein AGL19 isoform X3 [Carya illinoinensis]|uniref:agamous-like MADS-box protein AGL19 isoform X3 n=1 Tax=Carya illinoinensis TaxID=32201 RepID=UPI001C729A2E|nr:agamous-like MADS-box protein AGL19 isoform X3 [Carya illinoinensis]
MVRGKTQMKRIENAASRQVTFSKRRNGLLKKAFELSVLCDAEVALIVFSQSEKLYEFSSSGVSKTIERYQKRTKDELGLTGKSQENLQQHLIKEDDSVSLAKKLEIIEVSKRLVGEGLESCSVDELQELENQLMRSLCKISARKNQLFREQVEQLRKEERCGREENAKLRQKCGMQPRVQIPKSNIINDGMQCGMQPRVHDPNHQSRKQQDVLHARGLDVETELFIGPPKR